MVKYFVFSCMGLFFLQQQSTAQFKLNTNVGAHINTNANNDTTSIAKNTGTAISMKPSYSWGRIAATANLSIINHVGASLDDIRNRLNVDTGSRPTGINGGGFTAISAFVGPELCICYKKIRILPTIRVGVVRTSIKEIALSLRGQGPAGADKPYYLLQQTSTDIGFQTGVTFGYKINNKIAITATSEYTDYKANFQIIDYRNSSVLPRTPKTVVQGYNFLTVATGVTYSF